MAEVKLVNIKKVYPYVSGEEKKKNKKKSADEPEKKKVNLQTCAWSRVWRKFPTASCTSTAS